MLARVNQVHDMARPYALWRRHQVRAMLAVRWRDDVTATTMHAT